jgi:hypothetical protein
VHEKQSSPKSFESANGVFQWSKYVDHREGVETPLDRQSKLVSFAAWRYVLGDLRKRAVQRN